MTPAPGAVSPPSGVRDDDKRVYGDAGHTRIWKYLNGEREAPDSRSCIAAKRGAIKKMEDSPTQALLLAIETTKTNIRPKVEHSFHVIKNLFGAREVHHQGLGKSLTLTVQSVRTGQSDAGDTMRELS